MPDPVMIDEVSAAGRVAERPDHVAPHLVHDIDFLCPDPAAVDPILAWGRHVGLPPIVWTPRHGGHWIATRGDVFDEIYLDPERFSSRSIVIGPRLGRPRLLPSEYDPPEHAVLRKQALKAFEPRSVKRWTEEARELAGTIIDALAAKGRCEFVEDFAKQLPMIIILRMFDLPQDDREMLLRWVYDVMLATDPAAAMGAQQAFARYVDAFVREKRAHPGDDVMSNVLTSPLADGRRLTHDEAVRMATNLIFGGLDTVAATMGWVALYLAQQPQVQDRLRGDKALIARSIDEFLRRFAVSQVAREVTHDSEFHGASLKAGEQVLMPSLLHSLDPAFFDDPEAVDLDRRNAHTHHTLGAGVHRCAGALLGHAELRVFLEEWLSRLPTFRLDPASPPVMRAGFVARIDRLDLVW